MITAFCLSGFLLASGTSETPTLHRYEYSQLHMGVRVNLRLYAEDRAKAEAAATAAFARFAELEAIMSDYRPDSELMRLCANSGRGPVPVSQELFFVLRRAKQVSILTEGAFDVTVGPLVKLWRQTRDTVVLPSEEQLSSAMRRVGYQKMLLDPQERTVELLQDGMQLDLGGIAKGYACDEALRVLGDNGVRHALVQAGGDIVATDPPPRLGPWQIASTRPGDEPISLTKGAMSTSGSTEQFVLVGGQRFGHIVDPRTGLGVERLLMVTVEAPDGITADSLATAFCVAGVKDELMHAFGATQARASWTVGDGL